jgi:hypothetical protein
LNFPPLRPNGTDVPELEEGPGLIASSWRHKWMIAILTLLGVAAGIGAAQLQPVLYEGVARVLPPPSLTVQEGIAVDPVRSLQNQAAIMSSTPVLSAAARRYGKDTTADLLRKRVSVQASQEADVLTVRALDPTPEGAARLANAMVQAYQEVVALQSRQDADARIASLRQQRQALQTRLDSIRQSLIADPNDPALLTEQQAVGAQYQSLVSQEYQLQEAAAQAGLAGLLEAAEVPRTPKQPKPLLLMVGGGLAALVASVLLAWVVEVARARRLASGRPWFEVRRANLLEMAPPGTGLTGMARPPVDPTEDGLPMLTASPPAAPSGEQGWPMGASAAARLGNGVEPRSSRPEQARPFGWSAETKPSDPDPTTELPKLPERTSMPLLRPARTGDVVAARWSVGPADGPAREWSAPTAEHAVVGGDEEAAGDGLGMDLLEAGSGGGAGDLDGAGLDEPAEGVDPGVDVAGAGEPAGAGAVSDPEQLWEAADVGGDDGQAGGEGLDDDHGLALVPGGGDGEGAGAEHAAPDLDGVEPPGEGDAGAGAPLELGAKRAVPDDDDPD